MNNLENIGDDVMPGKMIFTIIGLLIATIILLHVYSFFIHISIKNDINQINFYTIYDISDSGIFKSSTYDGLKEKINKHGDYKIALRLDKQVKPGIYDTYFNKAEILDKYLRKGDKITIYLEDKKLTWFGRLVNLSFLSKSPKNAIDNRIRSVKSAVITKNAKDIVKGYDVIADISNKRSNSSIAILVSTKMNSNGKYYGDSSHKEIITTNLKYGDSLDEEYPGINYIFDNGDFMRKIEYDSNGLIELVKYIQQ
ncbi:MAG: hypothetical protein FH761_12850 [Firmicutes bacterium]|nr:hypothetical protein [Bacillota bacterium]